MRRPICDDVSASDSAGKPPELDAAPGAWVGVNPHEPGALQLPGLDPPLYTSGSDAFLLQMTAPAELDSLRETQRVNSMVGLRDGMLTVSVKPGFIDESTAHMRTKSLLASLSASALRGWDVTLKALGLEQRFEISDNHRPTELVR